MSTAKLYFTICVALMMGAMITLNRVLHGMSEQFLDGLFVGTLLTISGIVFVEHLRKKGY